MALRWLEDFCPPGMRISTPEGLSLNIDHICAMEPDQSKKTGDYRLIIHLPSSCITVCFFGNIDGTMPDVRGLQRNIMDAQKEDRDGVLT